MLTKCSPSAHQVLTFWAINCSPTVHHLFTPLGVSKENSSSKDRAKQPGNRSQLGSSFVARKQLAMSHTPQSRHIVGAVLAGLLLEDWLSTRELCPLRAASTAGFEACSLAIRSYSCLVHQREQRRRQLLASPVLVEDSSEEDHHEEDPIVVSDDDDTWEEAFGRDADWD